MNNRPCRVNPLLLSFAREMRHKPAPAEQTLWYRLRNRRLNGFKFRRQFAIGRYIADFYCADCGLVVELDGDSHADRQVYDADRTEELNRQGLFVLRFSNEDVHKRLDGVLRTILRECEQRDNSKASPSPQPSPLSTGERE